MKSGEFDDLIQFSAEEELITKRRAIQLFDSGTLFRLEIGSFKGLSEIHRYIFGDIFDFAGQMRTVDLAKGDFRFPPAIYLRQTLNQIDRMPQKSFDQIIEKYVEMNVAHPFREGNGRSMRIWLDAMLAREIGSVVEWSRIERDQYLETMEISPIEDRPLKYLIQQALNHNIYHRDIYMNGIDRSYQYEGYCSYSTEDIRTLCIQPEL